MRQLKKKPLFLEERELFKRTSGMPLKLKLMALTPSVIKDAELMRVCRENSSK